MQLVVYPKVQGTLSRTKEQEMFSPGEKWLAAGSGGSGLHWAERTEPPQPN